MAPKAKMSLRWSTVWPRTCCGDLMQLGCAHAASRFCVAAIDIVRPHFSGSAAAERRRAMHQSITTGCSIPDFCSQYENYLFRVRGLSASTRKLHRHVVCRFLTFRFPDGKIALSELRFTDLADFLKEGFTRLSSRETQRVWLTILRSVLRYLSEAGQIPKGWEGALPKVANH